MPFAVTLRLDPASAQLVQRVWHALDAAGYPNAAAALGYAPHLTLAVLDDSADAARLVDTVRAVASGWRAMPLQLSGIAAFPGDPATLWLAPVVTAPLLTRHAALCAALPQVQAYYRPDAWVPHVTLADDIIASEVGAGLGIAAGVFQPIAATLDRIDVLHFRPIAMLWQAPLTQADTPA